MHQTFYETALVRFGVTKHELLRIIADNFVAFPNENKMTWENEELWRKYVLALQYGADPVATNALIKVVDAKWIPHDGPGRLDWALRKCYPGWMDSGFSKQFNDYAWRVASRQEEQRRTEERCTKDQQIRRLSLLWWRPDDSSVSNNAAREQKLGKPPGDTVKTFEKILGEKLFQPMWTRSAEVFTMQKRLVQNGTYDVTNALSRFLIHKKTDAFRFPLLVGCVGTWKADMSGLAETIVSRFPPETRAEWYSSLVQTNWDPYAEWRSPRMTVRKAVFLRAASLAETDAACAAAIDQALPAVDTEWGGSNLRKRLALRFRDAAGEPGEHFRRVATDCGPPQPPTPQDLDELAAHSRIDWPEDAAYIGAKPPESDAEGFRVALMLAAAEFGLPERDLTRMLAERLLGIVLNGKREEFGGTRWNRYIAALEYAGQSAEQPDDAAYFHAVLQKAGQPEKKGDAR